jgi:Ca2+-binding EF-hand superfamily protein
MTRPGEGVTGGVRTLSADELADLEQEFAEADVDGDGRVDFGEFEGLLENLETELDPHGRRAAFTSMDADRDGSVTLGEFTDWWRRR